MQGDNGINNELIEMNLDNSQWSTVRDEFGSIDNVLIDGLTILSTPEGKVPRSRMTGLDDDHRITNVTLQNIVILGEQKTTLKEMKLSIDEYCENITVR